MSGVNNSTIQLHVLSMATVESRVICIRTKSSQSELDSQEWWRTCLTLASGVSGAAAAHEAVRHGGHARAAVLATNT